MDPTATDGGAPAGPLDAQLEAILGPAVRAAVQAAAHARAAQEDAGAGGSAETASLEQALQPLVGGLKEVAQAVRSLEGQLVRVAQDCTQRLEDGIKRVEAGIAPVYNQAVYAHNREQRCLSDSNRVPGCTLPLLPWMNSKGELPPAGLFPSSLQEMSKLLSTAFLLDMRTTMQELEERSARIGRLLHFYGFTPADAPCVAVEAWNSRHQLNEETLRSLLLLQVSKLKNLFNM